MYIERMICFLLSQSCVDSTLCGAGAEPSFKVDEALRPLRAASIVIVAGAPAISARSQGAASFMDLRNSRFVL
jgi:hypothetical protein